MTGHVGFAGGWTTATTQSGGGSPELRQRRRIDAPRAPGGSPCPCASRGTNGRCGGGRGSPEWSSWRRRRSGELGFGVREHDRRQRGVLRPPRVALSTTAFSVAALGNGGYGGDMAGGKQVQAPVGSRLQGAIEAGKREGRRRSSQ